MRHNESLPYSDKQYSVDPTTFPNLKHNSAQLILTQGTPACALSPRGHQTGSDTEDQQTEPPRPD